MLLDNKSYQKYAESKMKKTKIFPNCIKAFAVGGFICCIGELFFDIYIYAGLEVDTSKTLSSVTLIAIAAILTGFGVFDNIAFHAGAGTLVPITGFSNAVISPAIDYREEGYILGVGSKMFVIAGPVIVYGTIASIIYGVVLWFMQ